MIRKFALALALMLCAAPVVAQNSVPFRAVVGQPLIAAVDLPALAVGQSGISAQLKFLIDGSFQPSVVYGAPTGAARTVEFAVPPLTQAKTYTLSIALSYTITDTTKWSCGTSGIGTQTSAGLVCPDVFATNTIALTLDPPPVSIPDPAPTNFRVKLKPVLTAGGAAVDLEILLNDGRVITQRVPVVAEVRGNRVTLATETVIQR